MDAKLKRKWVKALRSGEYRQGRGLLVSNSGKSFCCLGVLADVAGCSWSKNGDGSMSPTLKRKEVGDGYMLVANFARLRGATMESLASKNDDGASFAEIADYIEKRIAGS